MHGKPETGDTPLPGSADYEAAYRSWLQTEYRPLAGGWQY
jgi:hypothetical protein